jgi:hypothetical protein
LRVRNTALDGIPQIVAIISISVDGRLNLKKAVRQHLGLGDAKTLFLDMQDEILLSTEEGRGTELSLEKGTRIHLPEGALSRLGMAGRSLVGLVQRRNAVAIKKLEIVEEEGERARLVDVETTYRIARKAVTNPMPEKLLPRLRERYEGIRLRYDTRGLLKGRQTREAWKARKILGMAVPSDEQLRRDLIRKRLERQLEDGSWEGRVTIIARNLSELADLGMTREQGEAQRAVDWSTARPQSAHNPGMFFSKDELVEEQARVVEERREAIEEGRRGTRARFRQLRASEKRLVMAGDPMICNPCGPRIMWPNALVLEALLALGYEDDDRVQTALKTMTTHEWCECGYQHGLSGWKRTERLTMDEIEEVEKRYVSQYRYGGIADTKELRHAGMRRMTHTPTKDGDEHLLSMESHLQGCEVITTRAMSRVRDKTMRRFAETHLWRFAGRQHALGGEFEKERYGGGGSAGRPSPGLCRLRSPGFKGGDHESHTVDCRFTERGRFVGRGAGQGCLDPGCPERPGQRR